MEIIVAEIANMNIHRFNQILWTVAGILITVNLLLAAYKLRGRWK